jgi:NADPH:quinone reductase-like Zn-dependent oxidoreductase
MEARVTKMARLSARFSKSMEAYHIDRFGGVDGIVLRSSADPRPGPKEILMRMRASSLNYHELMVLKGGGRGLAKLGVVPLIKRSSTPTKRAPAQARSAVGSRAATKGKGIHRRQ